MPTVAELLLERGRIAAEAAQQRAARQSNLVGGLANIAIGAIDQRRQEKAAIADQALKAQKYVLEMQKLQGDVDVQQRELQETDALKSLFAGPQPPTPEQIYGIVGPERGQKIITGLTALQSATTKQYGDRQTVIRDTLAGMDALPEPMRAEVYPQIRTSMVQNGVIGAQDAPETYDPAWFQQARAYGQQPTKTEAKVVGGALVDPVSGKVIYQAEEKPERVKFGEPFMALVNGKRQTVRTGSDGKTYDMRGNEVTGDVSIYEKPEAPKDERIVQIMGEGGVPVWVRESEAVGKPAAQAPRAVTGAERQSLAFYNRAKQAVEALEEADQSGKSLEQRMASLGFADQQRLGYEGMGSNYMKSPEMQQYRQAQRAFTEARLRKESGAAIPASEFENDAKTYFVQPGDDAATVARKQAARAEVLQGLGYSAGKAFDEFYGEPFKKGSKGGTKPPEGWIIK